MPSFIFDFFQILYYNYIEGDDKQMAKFIPTPEQLNTILTRYQETKNYSQVSRETGLSTAIIKRIISENEGVSSASTESAAKPLPKPKTTAQILAYRKEYQYTGLPPIETVCPKKSVYYGKMAMLKQEFLNV